MSAKLPTPHYDPKSPFTGILEAWQAGSEAGAAGFRLPRPDHCGGAYLFMTRKEAMKADAGGVKFETDPEQLPEEGRHGIRVRCKGEIAIGKNGTRYGLCNRCSGYEMGIRKRMREQAAKAKEPTRRSRRDQFTSDGGE